MTLRRVDWSVGEALEQLGLLLKVWTPRAPLREPDQGIFLTFASNFHWEVNAGPSGRAARIAFCSWQI
ncbi:MAG: hypothetical protein Q8M16_08600 [Pirellulaceae bacterium]|nr:hypothetical protein [Pirellulaceae bacterium]